MCHIPMALQNVYALLYEYRLLVAMNALGIKLDPGAQTRLLGLGRLLEGEGVPEQPSADAAGRRAMTRLPLRVLVRVSTAHPDLALVDEAQRLDAIVYGAGSDAVERDWP